MNPNDVIVRPVISEKTTELIEQNKYVFKVSLKANKMMIRQALKELFGVKAERINIIRVRGRKRRIRYKYGNTSAWKKAIITLNKNDKLTIFEGQ